LENITNKYVVNTKFKHIKPDLTKEVLKQTIEQVNKYSGFNNAKESDFRIKFQDLNSEDDSEISDNKEITNDMEIVFIVLPTNSFQVRGSFLDIFKPNLREHAGKDLSNFTLDRKKIIDMTRGHEGQRFIIIRYRLDKEIKNELREQGYDPSVASIGWAKLDDQIMHKGDEIKFSISSKNADIISGEFKGKFYFDRPDL